MIAAVIFDLDGVLVDSEQVWDEARRDVVAAHGGTWRDAAERANARHELEGMVGATSSSELGTSS